MPVRMESTNPHLGGQENLRFSEAAVVGCIGPNTEVGELPRPDGTTCNQCRSRSIKNDRQI